MADSTRTAMVSPAAIPSALLAAAIGWEGALLVSGVLAVVAALLWLGVKAEPAWAAAR